MPKQNGLENSHNNKIRQAQVKQSSAFLQIPKSNTVGRPKMTYDNARVEKKPVTDKDLPSGVVNRSKSDTPSYRISIMQNGVKMTAKTKIYEEMLIIRLAMLDGSWADPELNGGVWLYGQAAKNWFDQKRLLKKASDDAKNLPLSLRKPYQFNWHEQFLTKYFGEKTSVDEISHVDGNKFRDWMQFDTSNGKRMLAASTVNTALSNHQQILRNAKRLGYRSSDPLPVEWVSRKKGGRDRVFTPDEEDKVYDFFLNNGFLRTADFFKFQINTGLRPKESHSLRWRDINFVTKTINITAENSKTGVQRQMPFLGDVPVILEQLREHHLSTQPNDDCDEGAIVWSKVRYFTPRSAVRQMEMAREYLGKDNEKDFVWYACRHTCASRLVADGVSPSTIMSWLGWSSIQTLENYRHDLPHEFQGAVEKAEAGAKLRREKYSSRYDTHRVNSHDPIHDIIDHQDNGEPLNLVRMDANNRLLD